MAKITLKGNAITTIGELPAKNSKAHDFILVDADLKNHSLKDYHGKKKIISIVPSLDTAVCSLSAKKFNEALQNRKDVVCLVVSADLPFAQKRFCSAEHVNNVVTLSMMRNKDFGKDYGVLIIDGPLAGICSRAVIVLDEHDKVIYTEQVPEITQEPNYDKALQVIDSL